MTNCRLFGLAIFAASVLSAADLTVGASSPASVAPGATATAPVSYAARGAQLVALSFDLLYDKTKLTITADTGAASTAARKGVTTSDLAGGIRVLILGTNILDLTPVGDGVVANLTIRVASTASGSIPIQLANSTGSDSTGRSATLTPTGGSITVTGGGGGGTGPALAVGSGSPVSVAAGGTGTVAINFSARGAQLVALSFDLLYDKANLTITADTGAAATAARKGVQASDIAGGIRVLVLGTNILDLTPLGDGVVASLTIRAASAASGTIQIQLTNTTGSDATGRSATLSPTGGSVTVGGSGGGGGGGGASGRNQVIAHIADSGGWTTQFIFVNLDDKNPTQVTVNFSKEDGTPLPLSIEGEAGLVSSVVRAIASGGSVTIQTNGRATDNIIVGWAELLTSGQVAGEAIFRAAGNPDQFAAVGLTSSARHVVMPFDNTLGAVTAMALINTNKTSAARIDVTIRDERGVTILTDVMAIPANGHVSFELTSRWRLTVDKRGVLDFKSATPDITGLGFRFIGAAFASVPLIEVP